MSFMSIGGLLALLSSIIIYVVYGGINFKIHFETAFLWPKSVKDFAQMFGVCCLCFAVPFYGTSSQRSMDDKQKFPAVLYGSLLFSGLFYIVVGVGCSLLYNQRECERRRSRRGHRGHLHRQHQALLALLHRRRGAALAQLALLLPHHRLSARALHRESPQGR